MTVQLAFLPLLLIAYTVAVPAFCAFTMPQITVATALLLLVHVTLLLVAFDGEIVADHVNICPTVKDMLEWDREISVT